MLFESAPTDTVSHGRALVAAVIRQAVLDLKAVDASHGLAKPDEQARFTARLFLKSQECSELIRELGIPITKFRAFMDKAGL